jgi:hypothetical protein
MAKNLSLGLLVSMLAALAALVTVGLLVSPYEFTVEAGQLLASKVCLPAAGAIATAIVAAKLLQRRTTADLSGNRWIILGLVAIGLLLATALFRMLT